MVCEVKRETNERKISHETGGDEVAWEFTPRPIAIRLFGGIPRNQPLVRTVRPERAFAASPLTRSGCRKGAVAVAAAAVDFPGERSLQRSPFAHTSRLSIHLFSFPLRFNDAMELAGFAHIQLCVHAMRAARFFHSAAFVLRIENKFAFERRTNGATINSIGCIDTVAVKPKMRRCQASRRLSNGRGGRRFPSKRWHRALAAAADGSSAGANKL